MIKNDKQLTSSEKRLELLYQMADEYKDSSSLLDQGQHGTLVWQAESVLTEIEEYKKLKNTDINDLKFNLSDLAKVIVALRISSNLTQKELADKVGLQEQQIQRYEDQNYEKASFERIIQIIGTMVDDINLSFIKNTTAKRHKFENLNKDGLNLAKEMKQHKSMLDILPILNCAI